MLPTGPPVVEKTLSEASQWNLTKINLDDLKMDSNFAWLLCSLVTAIGWLIYISYYNSRVLGYIITRLLNSLYITDGHFSVGSLSFCCLSGKVMFRDIVYITHDYTLRIQDGWTIFRWWRAYVPKDVSEDFSHSDTRLSVLLNGFELHVYHRSQLYARLERLFDLEPSLIPRDPSNPDKFLQESEKESLTSRERPQPGSSSLGKSWRDLIPVIKIDLSSGRLVFGNRLVPNTLSIQVEEAHFMYTTKPAASRLDHFMHIVKCKAENFKVILAPSPKYVGMSDDPPRYMGEGFVVLSSNNVDLYFYMDEPGIVPSEPCMLQLANGDIVESTPPIWGIDIKCGKGTDFSYGPWADKQREHLFKFFFPLEYQPLKINKPPMPGEKRQVQSFDIRLSTLSDATIDILFSKNKETNAVHVNIGPGSYLEVTIPWIVTSTGYTTKITGQLLHLEATTSLQYRSLLESETLEYSVACHYPLEWNGHQEWLLNLTGCKATVWFIYAHKEFFQELVIDWSSKLRADLLQFVPYTWKFTVLMKEFEFIMPANEYNWIDCSSQSNENMYIAFCGELFDFSFDLPFVDFLPATLPLKFWIQGESMDLSMCLPEIYTSRSTLLSLHANAKLFGRDGNISRPRGAQDLKKWRSHCHPKDGWLDCWSVPIVALSINYIYHPMPPLGPAPQADITTPEKEEILLSPMRIQRTKKSPVISSWKQEELKFDPTSLEPDEVSLELEIGPSQLLIYGSWLLGMVHLKENIFGDDQSFTDMNQSPELHLTPGSSREPSSSIADDNSLKEEFDPRKYRPLNVNVSITMHDIQAHLVKSCSDKEPPCPLILVDRFGFEMKKSFRETLLQLVLSPAVLLSSDLVSSRPPRDRHLNQGHLTLSGLQLRGHAMFSDEGRSLQDETLEYAWLLELQLGKLSGRMTMPQMYHVISSLEALFLLIVDSENRLVPPRAPPPCHHNNIPIDCPESQPSATYRCPPPDQIKYRMVRVCVDALDVYVLESGTAINFWACPIRFSTCNLHGNQVKSGLTGVIPCIQVKQMIVTNNLSANNTTGSGRSQHRNTNEPEMWLEVGSVSLGPLILEAAVSLSKTDENLHLVQQRYLKEHDEKTRRLWLLWPGDKAGRCGCIGGCSFFGSNANGARFFRPTKQDIVDGINIAAFRVNERGKDPGYGQSILHDNQLVFHTPPYNRQEVSLYDVVGSRPPSAPTISHSKGMKEEGGSKVERSKSVTERKVDTPSPVPTVRAPSANMVIPSSTVPPIVTTTIAPSVPTVQSTAVQCGPPVLRRFSYTPSTPLQSRNTAASNGGKEVPYSRLVDTSPIAPETESTLSEKIRNVLMVSEGDGSQPKSSISDSKLAVEYFNTTAQQYSALVNSVKQVGLEASESEQSLQDRTQSITSDTHPEAFFSAEEGLASRSSSLRRNQMTECDWGGKRFGSDMNIVSRGWCCNHSSISPRAAHSSDIEIHYSPDQCVDGSRCLPPPIFHRASPRNDLTTHLDCNIQEGLTVLLDSSDTHSVSSTSFISAVSSQEDLTMVNLHMQVNKPIVDSPLLMTTYINHLSQATCTNWAQSAFPSGTDAFTLPLFNKTDDGKLVYIGSELIPKFETQVEGFTALKMVSRNRGETGVGSPPHSIGKTPTHPYSWDFMLSETCTEQNNQNRQSEELLSVRNDTGTRTTVVVKLKGDIDIMITPLALESLQRFIDGVTPTLAMLHPVTILNEVHLRCMGQVEASNILKRDQYLSQLQGGGSKRSTAERGRPVVGNNDKSHCVIEQCIATQVQATVILPKINIALLQASVVEEMISFSALDNIRDLTCVSLLAVSFENLTLSFHRAKQTREVVERLERPAVLPGGVKKSGFAKKVLLLGPRTSSTKHVLTGETVFVETSQNQHQETVLSINLSKVDAQLRRLDNECSLLKDAEITAIPSHCSRVMFSVKLDKCALKNQFSHLEHNSRPIEDPYFVDQTDEKLGFIMFEGGFQGVSFKIVKRSKFNIDEPEGQATNMSEEPKSASGDQQTKSESQKTHAPEPTRVEVPTGDTDQGKDAELQSVVIEQPPASGETHGAEEQTTKESQQHSNIALVNKGFGNLSSCIIDVKQVWFNFAAPPRTPITKKIDYTRLDWNLLSTASPAINAWMNPSNRFAIRVVHMLRCRYRRSTSVVTSLMADALDVQPLQMPTKSHYGRFTPLCSTLQEDPSCQLCSVLKRFALTSTNIDDNLREHYLPHLSTLRQGVIVLSRQWKNILYTPLLLEHSLKSKHHLKPCNVTFAIPDAEDQDNVLTDGEFSYEECEVTDESAMLLNTATDPKKVLRPQKTAEGPVSSPLQQSSHAFSSPTSPSSNNQSSVRKRCLLPTQVPSSSRASIVFPLFSNNLFKQEEQAANHPTSQNHTNNLGAGYSSLKEDYPKTHLGSNPSITSRRQGSIESVCEEGGVESEDLYTWMQQQMGSTGGQATVPPPPTSTPTTNPQNQTGKKELFGDIGRNNESTSGGGIMNPDYLLLSSGYSLYPMHDSLKLLDAHLIFEPLLTSLGVMPQQMITSTGMRSNSVDCWGTNMSLVGCVESMKVDIVVSEFGKPQDKKVKIKPENVVKLWVEVPPEAPAFVCEKIWLELDVSRRTDTGLVEDLGRQRRNTLYVSRGQLKKHSTTALNISVSIRYISQQVNMPLLRLLLQISNMYQNVKETQSELREQRPPADRPPTASNSNHHYNPLGGVSVDESEAGSRRDDDVAKGRPSSSASHHFRGPLGGGITGTSAPTPGIAIPYSSVPGRASSVVSPSSSLRAAQSFTSRIRSTSRSVRGYVNLSEGSQLTSPMCPDERRVYNKEESTPRCWKTVYNLLDLYASMPHTKTIAHSRFSVGGGEASDSFRSKKSDISQKDVPSTPILNPSEATNTAGVSTSTVAGSEERTRLMIFAVARIHRTRLLATLSGLKLEAEMSNLHSSLTVRKKTQRLQPSMEASLTAHVGRTMIVLLEGVPPNQQTVVKILIGKSQALFSSLSLPGKDKNSALLTVSAVAVTIPQHPVALHGMMARGSKHLSSTLQELRVSRTTSRVGRDESETGGNRPQSPAPRPAPTPTPSDSLLKPLTIQFTIVVQSLSITAALLPSLQAQYRMEHVTSTGVTAGKVKFVIDLPSHSLSFSTKATEANLPSEANIELPKVHVTAEYIQDNHPNSDRQFGDGVVLRHGNYLSALADIGVFEHSLTTDLLNHLVFVQKVFMKEVNEVVQKVYGGEKPVPLWEDDGSHSSSKVKQILFSLGIRLKRIQLTAVTPTNCAVRLETGCVDLQLSNRVENVSGRDTAQPNTSKLFAKANVEINLSLGQLIRNALFEEAEPEFQQYAFFKTRIGLRNAFQGETGGGGGEGKEVVVITLRRPLVYIQPMAVDKAILVWLNYKNAYEYWNEQRSSLNTEVLTATQQVFEKMPFEKLTGPPFLGTLFLQLTVEDMGICLPLNPLPHPSWGRQLYADDSCSAVVVTLESTSICACSWGSLVSKARFSGLCLRFADDFETSLDDWKPDPSQPQMNLCVVSEGTYEVCSRTLAAQKIDSENAKWFLNVQWAMEGVDIHLDVNIGKQLSGLGHTLTTLTGYQEDDPPNQSYDSDCDPDQPITNNSQESPIIRRGRVQTCDSLSMFALDPSIDAKKRSKLIEKEINEQAKFINDLRSLGASYGTIEQEMKRLRELENIIFKNFRRDMMQKLKRQSVKTSLKKQRSVPGKAAFRSRSFIVPSPTPEHALEIDSPDGSSLCSSPPTTCLFSRNHNSSSRVTFSESHNLTRQSSLPSASSELSLPVEGDLSEWNSSNRHSAELIPSADSPQSNYNGLGIIYGEGESSISGGSSTGATPGPNHKPTEPSVDFELDVKVLIKSGKCVLHTKDTSTANSNSLRAEDSELKGGVKLKKERSCSGGMFEFGGGSSPSMSRRSNKQSTSRLRNPQHAVTISDVTVFYIPGLDVKVHYESKTIAEGKSETGTPASGTNPTTSTTTTPGNLGTSRRGTKKASLFAWMTLQSIPEETVISPHILDFLEQTLEPIPTQQKSPSFQSGGTASGGDPVAMQYYASFPVDVIVYFHMQPSTFRFSCLPVSRVECMLQLPSVDIVFSSKRSTPPQGPSGSTAGIGITPGTAGGISVTSCLSDFSLYIFHPYGGKKSGVKEAQWSPLQDTERKDSLSVNVEFVKLHLSRSNHRDPTTHHQVVRFSTIVDIGSAWFKYDMRRLTEILAFPKAWYRRSIMRRLFLGDISTSHPQQDNSDVDITASHVNSNGEKSNLAKDKMNLQLDPSHNLHYNLGEGEISGESSPGEKGPPAWETLVLFAVHFKRLNVHMNMGNVMGNVMLMTKDLRSEGRLSIGSCGHKNMYVGLGLAGATLDAKGGIVGGTIDLSNIDTFVVVREERGTEPDHLVGLKLGAVEFRLDYMGTAVLMSRISSLETILRDEWNQAKTSHTRRATQIFVHGDLGWDQLQMMISKSTTVDLLKMYAKLEEFFMQQFNSSKRVFSSLGRSDSQLARNTRPKKNAPNIDQVDCCEGTRHHRHWQRALGLTPECGGTILGGTLDLHGTNISLACFHGINFKSKSWALFSLKEPFISFSTEAQQVPSSEGGGTLDSHIVETLTLSLGLAVEQQAATAHHHSMATVCRVSRNIVFPPQFKTIHEWFHYAFSCSDIDAVDRFPCVERERDASEGAVGRVRAPPRPPDPNHTREVIFALPSFQTVLKTEHLQPSTTPSTQDPDGKPCVECSFVTEFEDHIFVTVDAECFFFLHDLITSYVREKDKIGSGSSRGQTDSDKMRREGESSSSTSQESSNPMLSSIQLQTNLDWRNFQCKTWHLEPTVRLLSWGGKSIEPYGVDYILQKLGFSQARLTIPKWMQRGFMDPLDKVLSLLVSNMLQIAPDIPQENKNSSN